MGRKVNAPLIVASSLSEALSSSKISMTATWSQQPFVFPSNIQPGSHITTLGSDEPGKQEVDAALIKDSTFICDDRLLTMKMGAVGNAGLDSSVIDAELGEVLACHHPGRMSDG